jgi:hypothetical protein
VDLALEGERLAGLGVEQHGGVRRRRGPIDVAASREHKPEAAGGGTLAVAQGRPPAP